MEESAENKVQWFVMRDLKRPNASCPAYRMLAEKGFEVFTPMRWRISVRNGRRVREEVPFLHDLLFVCAGREALDLIVAANETLQYRWLRGTYREPMVVGEKEMRRFIAAVKNSDAPRYFAPEEITPAMYNKKVRLIGGPLEGYEGYLLTRRGSKKRHFLFELPGLLAASIEVEPEFIQFI
ncbi:MAG: UpxY family transcription antiterminator [Prevotella sp.]|nr:UpxY family transcription antiterminator [Prevotella sp.]